MEAGDRGSSESDQDDVMDDESSGGEDCSEDDEAPLPGRCDKLFGTAESGMC